MKCPAFNPEDNNKAHFTQEENGSQTLTTLSTKGLLEVFRGEQELQVWQLKKVGRVNQNQVEFHPELPPVLCSRPTTLG